VPRLSLSTQSMHRRLGKTSFDADLPGEVAWASLPSVRLYDLPRELQRNLIGGIDLVHAHLPRIDRAYLHDFASACGCCDVAIESLELAFGDFSAESDEARQRDIERAMQWIDIAHQLKSPTVAVHAGWQDGSPEAIDRSVESLTKLAEHATNLGVLVMISNEARGLAKSPSIIHELLQRTDGKVGLCVDFASAAGPSRFTTLDVPAGEVEHFREELGQFFLLCSSIAFDGCVSLASTTDDNEWPAARALRDVVHEVGKVPLGGD
jgi:hypothetical protein